MGRQRAVMCDKSVGGTEGHVARRAASTQRVVLCDEIGSQNGTNETICRGKKISDSLSFTSKKTTSPKISDHLFFTSKKSAILSIFTSQKNNILSLFTSKK